MTAILGGGIAGLSAAYYALENPKLGPLIIYESSNRLGGWIHSEKSKSGAIFEKGPRTVRPNGVAGKKALRMIDNLQLTDKIIPIPSTQPSANNRLIYADNKLHYLPNSFKGLFKINSPFRRPLISVIWNDLRAKKINQKDESLYNFAERRFGRDVADYLISSILCGITAGDAKKISVNFLMKGLFEIEQQHGSIVKGLIKNSWKNMRNFKAVESLKAIEEKLKNNVGSAMRADKEKWSIWSLEGGLEQLPQRLGETLQSKNVKISLNTKVQKITFKSNFVELEINGKPEKYDRIVSSLSAQSIGKFLEGQHPELAKELCAIPTVTVGVINIEYPGKVLPMEAFGFLIPPKEKLPILGVIFDSCIFPQESSTVLTVMMGGAWFNEYFGDNPSKEYLESVALKQLRQILGIKVDPLEINSAILKDCIPQYVVGHEERLKRIRDYIAAAKIPLVLCGSSYQGVGINDVILSAEQAVYDIS